jgi:hypothetical protein
LIRDTDNLAHPDIDVPALATFSFQIVIIRSQVLYPDDEDRLARFVYFREERLR